MRRRITLYIDGQQADLADDALVLMNYALTDLTNPAAIRNDYSHAIDLPRTETNARIFGSSFRLDRNAGPGGTGAGFNASVRTPFSIQSETGEIMSAGYLKLSAITRDAYRVSMYGGLGDFLYGLSSDADGNRRTLADLDFGEDLDFTITADTVAEAWARLRGDATKPGRWDVINFAPCYNGLPDDFEAAKALAIASDVGLPVPAGKQTRGGYTVVNLQAPADEWAAKDLRSYLQRPVVSMARILSAIADPANNGGWTVDLSDIEDVPYRRTWLTRPLLPSLGGYKQTGGGIDVAFAGGPLTTGNDVGAFTVAGVPSGASVTVRVRFRLGYEVHGAGGAAFLYSNVQDSTGWTERVVFVQPVAYDAAGIKVAAGRSVAMYRHVQPTGGVTIDPAFMAAACGYSPDPLNTEVTGRLETASYENARGDFYRQTGDTVAEVTGVNVARVELIATGYIVAGRGSNITIAYQPNGPAAGQYLFDGNGQALATSGAYTEGGSGEASYMSADTLRSGALITKAMLLTTGHTPADYLVSFCKVFGLAIVADGASRTARVLRRASLFNGAVIDLTRRIDLAGGIDIKPLTFDRRWYEWRIPGVGGRFERQYAETEGVDYGIQRVDTGYEFDAEVRNVLDGSAFRSAAAVRDRSPYWYTVNDAGTFLPSLFLSTGNTYTLWGADGSSEDYTAPVPSADASVTPYDGTFPGYDTMSRAEFRDADNRALDGADVLLFHTFDRHMDRFALTDDVAAMDSIIGGPCWLIGPNHDGLDVPQFTRYSHRGQDPEWLLDLGHPREVDIPGINYGWGKSAYEAAWAQYIRDRLDVHGKVMTARVDLSGLGPVPALLRSFFWYGGALWSLAKISNYSLTTFDPAECEFVQVRDTTAYTGGQSY